MVLHCSTITHITNGRAGELIKANGPLPSACNEHKCVQSAAVIDTRSRRNRQYYCLLESTLLSTWTAQVSDTLGVTTWAVHTSEHYTLSAQAYRLISYSQLLLGRVKSHCAIETCNAEFYSRLPPFLSATYKSTAVSILWHKSLAKHPTNKQTGTNKQTNKQTSKQANTKNN